MSNNNDDFEKLLKSLEVESAQTNQNNQENIQNTEQNTEQNIDNNKESLPSKRVEIVKNTENSIFKDADHSIEYSNYLMSRIHPNMGFKEDEEDIENAEKEYIDALLDYESELKEIKQRFKNITMDFNARGVNTRIVNRTVKQIARDSRKLSNVIKEESKIASRLYNNKDLIAKICAVLN